MRRWNEPGILRQLCEMTGVGATGRRDPVEAFPRSAEYETEGDRGHMEFCSYFLIVWISATMRGADNGHSRGRERLGGWGRWWGLFACPSANVDPGVDQIQPAVRSVMGTRAANEMPDYSTNPTLAP